MPNPLENQFLIDTSSPNLYFGTDISFLLGDVEVRISSEGFRLENKAAEFTYRNLRVLNAALELLIDQATTQSQPASESYIIEPLGARGFNEPIQVIEPIKEGGFNKLRERSLYSERTFDFLKTLPMAPNSTLVIHGQPEVKIETCYHPPFLQKSGRLKAVIMQDEDPYAYTNLVSQLFFAASRLGRTAQRVANKALHDLHIDEAYERAQEAIRSLPTPQEQTLLKYLSR